MRTFLWILVFAATLFSGYWVYESLGTTQKFETVWAEDMVLLAGEKKLPKEWDQIKEVELETLSDESAIWMKSVPVPIQKRQDGTHRLEVEVDNWEDGSEFGAVVHYHLVEIKTNNTVWELGRTFALGTR